MELRDRVFSELANRYKEGEDEVTTFIDQSFTVKFKDMRDTYSKGELTIMDAGDKIHLGNLGEVIEEDRLKLYINKIEGTNIYK